MSIYLDRVARINANPEQLLAFQNKRSCVVIAGPGSGKTYLLTTKIAKYLYDEIPAPRGAACITYSRLMARQLKSEFAKLGVSTTRLFIGTVHGFCLSEIVQPYRHFCDWKIPNPFRVASKEQREQAIQVALLEQGVKLNDKKFINNIAKELDRYRRKHPNFEETHESKINWSLLAQRYTDLLLQEPISAIDFVHLELIALRLISKTHFVKQSIEAKYPVIAIDEYQDLSYPFHLMTSSLFEGTDIKLLTIGDADQCIYEKLQGTSPQYMEEIKQKIAARDKQSPITLIRNYRCADELIRISEVVIGDNRGYQSDSKNGKCFCINCKNGFQQQIKIIKEKILPKILKNSANNTLRYKDVAILHKRREPLQRISNSISEWRNHLDKNPFYDACELTEWVEQLALWCKNKKVDFEDIFRLWLELNRSTDHIQTNQNELELKVELVQKINAVRGKYDLLSEWLHVLVKELDLFRLLEAYKRIRPDEVTEFNRLFEASRSNNALGAWSLDRFARSSDGIQLTTFHSSKGTEFEVVIIAGMDELTEADQRLAYVVMTRAKKVVYVLYSGHAHFVEKLKKHQPQNCFFHSI